MRKLFTQLVLLTTLPSIFAHPQETLQQASYEESRSETSYNLTYDEVLQLLHEIESGELEKKCSPEELERVIYFMTFLAKQGQLPDDSEESASLEGDIEELLGGMSNPYDYMVIPATSQGYGEVILCKGWVAEKWKETKKFVKKHQKEIIIGAVVVVGVAVVAVVVVAASSASAGAAAVSAVGAAFSSGSDKPHQDRKEESQPGVSVPTATSLEMATAAIQEAPTLKAVMDEQIFAFKDHVVKEQFFQPIYPMVQQQALSWEENGRALGSLFAHESLKNIEQQIADHPRLAQEVQALGAEYHFSIAGGTCFDFGHPEIDRRFSTDYGPLYAIPESDFYILSHQVRGERALAYGYYDQAVQDLDRAIELNPTNPLPYLERGIAHFGLGQYDLSVEDYQTFTSQAQKTYPLCIPDFGRGFAKGLPRGIYDSGEGLFLLVADLVRHPIHTGGQMWSALTLLSELARSEEWSVLSEVLAPEIHQLVKQWDTLPSDVRGELAGYAFGKYGSDILIPGALAKAVSRGLKGAQKVSAVYRGLQTAEQTLLLESVASLESGAKIAEVIEASHKTLILGEELGLPVHEMAQLKQAGQLERVVATTCERIAQDPAMRESFELFERAKLFLKPYSKGFMPEAECRELIHQAGIRTFPRPEGIPDNFMVKLSRKGAGMEYVHPTDMNIRIRIMPGKPHSPFPYQQKPYVIQMKDGKAVNKFGKGVLPEDPEAHIPLEEFIYWN